MTEALLAPVAVVIQDLFACRDVSTSDEDEPRPAVHLNRAGPAVGGPTTVVDEPAEARRLLRRVDAAEGETAVSWTGAS